MGHIGSSSVTVVSCDKLLLDLDSLKALEYPRKRGGFWFAERRRFLHQSHRLNCGDAIAAGTFGGHHATGRTC